MKISDNSLGKKINNIEELFLILLIKVDTEPLK